VVHSSLTRIKKALRSFRVHELEKVEKKPGTGLVRVCQKERLYMILVGRAHRRDRRSSSSFWSRRKNRTQ
jgi:hypothetical protein